MSFDDYFLIFSSHFDQNPDLEVGRLSLNSLSEGTIQVWQATSSIGTKQKASDIHERGGYIPPQYRVFGLKNYLVQIKPIPLPEVKGVEGNFYRILPHEVRTDEGGKRSDFGIHLDANVPGSLGCIVLEKTRFEQFEEELDLLSAKKISLLPLFIQYS